MLILNNLIFHRVITVFLQMNCRSRRLFQIVVFSFQLIPHHVYVGSLDFTFAARRLLLLLRLLLLRLLRFLLLLRVLVLPFHRLYPEPAGATSFCGPGAIFK